jgi:hypothetical protein
VVRWLEGAVRREEQLQVSLWHQVGLARKAGDEAFTSTLFNIMQRNRVGTRYL